MMVSRLNRFLTHATNSLRIYRRAAVAASLASSLLLSSGCSTGRTCYDGKPYCVKSVNLGLVRLDFEHRNRTASSHNGGCSIDSSGSGQSIVSSVPLQIQSKSTRDAHENVNAFESSSPAIDHNLNHPNRNGTESVSNIRFKPIPVESAADDIQIVDETSSQPIETPTSSRRRKEVIQESLDFTTLNSPEEHEVNEPAESSLLVSDASEATGENNDEAVEKMVEESQPQDKLVGDQPLNSILSEAIMPLNSILQDYDAFDPVTSPLKAIANGYQAPTPLERLASLAPPHSLPGPHALSNDIPWSYDFGETTQQHVLEPMIRLRAIPVQKRIPPKPSIAQFRAFPEIADGKESQPLKLTQPHEATGQKRDNWR